MAISKDLVLSNICSKRENRDMTALPAQFAEVTRVLGDIRMEGLGDYRDAELLALIAESSRHERLARAHSAVLAGELARRSAPELGHDGLAQRLGHRTAQKLIQSTTGSTSRDAAQAVRIGGLEKSHPWLADVSRAVSDGTLSTDAADSIRAGLGAPVDGVSATRLEQAADVLTHDARTLDADRLFARARELRDELHAVGIIDRERAAREARELRLHRLRDGTVRIVWQLCPVEGSVVAEIFDRATSPRRGGPRFVTEGDHAQRIADDPRSTEQLASDVFFGLVTAGAEVRPTELLGRGAPAVRVMVTARELRERSGHGRLQSSQLAVSIETVERLACSQGTVPIVFDEHGHALDVGREHRLFTARQRIALAARDGGCLWTGCERPPSWCEAHHIEHWARDGGRTDVADGVLLCRHHHLLLHDHHWQIERRGLARSDYWLIPPPGHPASEPRRLASKSLTLREVLTS
jgi:hypothetical protein